MVFKFIWPKLVYLLWVVCWFWLVLVFLFCCGLIFLIVLCGWWCSLFLVLVGLVGLMIIVKWCIVILRVCWWNGSIFGKVWWGWFVCFIWFLLFLCKVGRKFWIFLWFGLKAVFQCIYLIMPIWSCFFSSRLVIFWVFGVLSFWFILWLWVLVMWWTWLMVWMVWWLCS